MRYQYCIDAARAAGDAKLTAGGRYNISVPTGVYIAVPFCKTKCSYCNFASDVFAPALFGRYVERVCGDIGRIGETAATMGARLDRECDSIYLGGGTPSLLAPAQLAQLFGQVRAQFDVARDAEITVECAPGTITDSLLAALVAAGVNRVSLGVQSFVDEETRAVGRLHTREVTLRDIERLRAAGIVNLNVDLIAGLPHQTSTSWQRSLDEVIATGVPHVSVYMLEIDEESRLGTELLAGGERYHAHFVPDDDLTAEFYETACDRLESAAIAHYEISNFARAGAESRHNLKYWTRQPYVGFGVDAHSMLCRGDGMSVRYAWPDSLDAFIKEGSRPTVAVIDREAALEESFFLGLRLNRGVDLEELRREFGGAVDDHAAVIEELIVDALLQRIGERVRLTARGRMVSNEVLARFVRENPPQRRRDTELAHREA